MKVIQLKRIHCSRFMGPLPSLVFVSNWQCHVSIWENDVSMYGLGHWGSEFHAPLDDITTIYLHRPLLVWLNVSLLKHISLIVLLSLSPGAPQRKLCVVLEAKVRAHKCCRILGVGGRVHPSPFIGSRHCRGLRPRHLSVLQESKNYQWSLDCSLNKPLSPKLQFIESGEEE